MSWGLQLYTLSSAEALCHHSCLQTTILPLDTWCLVEDMAFEGKGIFQSETDLKLHRMDKNIKASRTLEVSTNKPSKHRISSSRQWNKMSLSPERSGRPQTTSSTCSSIKGKGRFPQTQHVKTNNPDNSNRVFEFNSGAAISQSSIEHPHLSTRLSSVLS